MEEHATGGTARTRICGRARLLRHRVPALCSAREVIVRSGAVIYAGVTIGDGTVVGHHTLLRSFVTRRAEGSQLGHNLTVERASSIGARVRCSPGSHLTSSCVLADRVFLGAGVRTVNDRELIWRDPDREPELVPPRFEPRRPGGFRLGHSRRGHGGRGRAGRGRVGGDPRHPCGVGRLRRARPRPPHAAQAGPAVTSNAGAARPGGWHPLLPGLPGLTASRRSLPGQPGSRTRCAACWPDYPIGTRAWSRDCAASIWHESVAAWPPGNQLSLAVPGAATAAAAARRSSRH